MTTLCEDWVRLLKGGKTIRINGFSGVSAYFELGDGKGNLDRVCIVAADEDTLFRILQEYMPDAQVSGAKFQTVTVIKSQHE